MKILVTGAKGFVGGYIVEKLLENNFYVIGLDNETKYGALSKSYDKNTNYKEIEEKIYIQEIFSNKFN